MSWGEIEASYEPGYRSALATAREKVRRKAKLKAKIQSAYRQFDEASEELKKCTAILAKEHADVLSLEGLSLTGIFHSLIGNREQKLAIEQQEYIAAKLKYDAARESAQQLKLELTRLESELSLMDEVEREYEQLISEKESYLSASQTQAARELVEVGQRLADLESDRRELSEAIQAGEQALSRLETVRSSLSSATNWGMADMFGGGMLTTMVKHSAMDRAKNKRMRLTKRSFISSRSLLTRVTIYKLPFKSMVFPGSQTFSSMGS